MFFTFVPFGMILITIMAKFKEYFFFSLVEPTFGLSMAKSWRGWE
jgi:hypothetical protein